jgi:hypothetical protein
MEYVKKVLPPTEGRVALASKRQTLEIRQRDAERVGREWANASHDELSDRIAACQREWDMERTLELNASIAASIGIAAAWFRNIRWVLFSLSVLAFLAQHALQGWCPPMPVFRALGFRTAEEIQDEIFALRILRGDLKGLSDIAAKGKEQGHGQGEGQREGQGEGQGRSSLQRQMAQQMAATKMVQGSVIGPSSSKVHGDL